MREKKKKKTLTFPQFQRIEQNISQDQEFDPNLQACQSENKNPENISELATIIDG